MMKVESDWRLSLPFGGRTRSFDLLGRRLPVDGRRIYATGMSNGGMTAHRLAADSTLVAAVAPTLADANEVMWRFFAAHPLG